MQKSFLFFFIFCVSAIVAMDTSIITNSLSLKPGKIISIFNPKKELETGRSWDEVVPGTVMITPDNKGILLTERGKVKRLLFDDEHCCVKTLIEHPCATKNFPLIAMAKKKDGSLIIVSAGNYKNAKNNNKIAEYILYHNEWSKVKKLEEPIQAISLDSSGKKLAIATQYYVKIIDLKTDREDEVSFQ